MGLNSSTTDVYTNNTLFTIEDALDEEYLKLGAVLDKPDHKNNQEAGELSAKATKSNNAKVPVYLLPERKK